MPVTSGTLVMVLCASVASAVFARCLVRADNSFGLMFTHLFGAPEALVSYFNWFGGQPDGKYHSSVVVELGDRPLVGIIKRGFKLQYIHP